MRAPQGARRLLARPCISPLPLAASPRPLSHPARLRPALPDTAAALKEGGFALEDLEAVFTVHELVEGSCYSPEQAAAALERARAEEAAHARDSADSW